MSETTSDRSLRSCQFVNSEEDSVECPSCNQRIKNFEIDNHCKQELERLKEDQQKTAAELRNNSLKNSTDELCRPWTDFKRVQRNRQARLKQRLRKRPQTLPEHPCPLCGNIYLKDEIQNHVEDCLQNNTRNGSISDEGIDEYEEYEWAGQKRIRVSSLLQGGYAAIGIGQTIVNHTNLSDNEEDLNVDEDDTQVYGPAQYSENDLSSAFVETNENIESNEHSKDMPALNKFVLNNETEELSNTDYRRKMFGGDAVSESTMHTPTSSSSPAHFINIIDSLKIKLRQYENQIPNKYKCLICLDDYRNPAISVSCWHVHCDKCWLRSLGMRKLCPQCNVITTPKDLRRIYM
ncbi:E3 ubiquitin-protein ligase RNF220 [Teleopsis dalmanni]|uniref:E3 ubiquitin-protein ligase RNF220 n=1 Tax=Teleopsis dalmanni TaxID=139649 RepID=UPI0018CD7F0B|nr:E3 ubiquitin-protein ligase RNF220 [Teleopsis dalmanni]